MTVDEQSDYDLIATLIRTLGTDRGWLEYAEYMEKHHEVKAINQTIGRNEGFTRSLQTDQP